MFDWNDEELADIVWDEGGEVDDHTVPYSDQTEKPPILFRYPAEREINQESANISHLEQKKPSIKYEHGVGLDSDSKYDNGDPARWPDELYPSLSDATKADENSTGTDASNNLTKNLKNGSLRDETSQFDKDSEMFQNPPEDREQGDFVDYGWANIGSFDDLDRIFSNNNAVFGDMGIGSTYELWSSSKDVTNSPLGPTPLPCDCSDLALGPLRISSYRSETKANHSSLPGSGKSNEITSHAPVDAQTFETGGKIRACHKQLDDGTAATLNEYPDKLFSCVQSHRQKGLLKGQELEKKSEVFQLHDSYVTWSSFWSPFQQVHNQYAPAMFKSCPSVVPTQQRQLQRPWSLQQDHFSGPLRQSPLYGNVVNYHSATSILSQSHPGDENRELLSSGYEVPPAMTPKEKIEKLRKRHQMRAILAIQKQQQQFSNQVAVAEHSNVDGGNVEVDEGLSIFPSLDPNSPIENDDYNKNSIAYDNCSVEESILYQLQDAIAKLELQIRLCIRDSLFRLAQSAKRRQYPCDTSSSNTSTRDEVLGKKDSDSHERFTRMPDVVERDTNPIDRTVAHLLFLRPPEFSGKPAEMPESLGSKSGKFLSEDTSENTSNNG